MACLQTLPGIVEGDSFQISCFWGHLGQLMEAMAVTLKVLLGTARIQ